MSHPAAFATRFDLFNTITYICSSLVVSATIHFGHEEDAIPQDVPGEDEGVDTALHKIYPGTLGPRPQNPSERRCRMDYIAKRHRPCVSLWEKRKPGLDFSVRIVGGRTCEGPTKKPFVLQHHGPKGLREWLHGATRALRAAKSHHRDD